MKVRAADSSETLLKVIKNPITAHLPVGALAIGLEAGARLIDPFDLPKALPKDTPLVFFTGSMSHGDIPGVHHRTFALSKFPLSTACFVSKLLNAFEHAWGVV